MFFYDIKTKLGHCGKEFEQGDFTNVCPTRPRNIKRRVGNDGVIICAGSSERAASSNTNGATLCKSDLINIVILQNINSCL